MLQGLVPQVSSFASQVDNLLLLLFVIVGFWYIATNVMFFWLLVKFRARDGQKAQYLDGHETHLKVWITRPHAIIIACDVVLVVGAIMVWYNIKQSLPEAQETVRIVGQQWAWTFVHPGPDGKFDTDDDISTIDELHVAQGTTYHFKLQSKDVLHSFSVPTFRLKQDAVPGREITGWFKPMVTGEYDIECAEMCGIAHGLMGAKLFVENSADHAAWLQRASETRVASR